MYRFIRASQTGDVNCLLKGKYDELTDADGKSLESMFNDGWTVSAMAALDTGFILLALKSP